MLLHRSNIDICQSLNIGNDNDGHNLKIRIDKLTVVSDLLPEEDKRVVYSKLEKMNQRSEKTYRVEYVKNKKEKPYRKSLNIYSRKNNSPVLLHIDYVPKHPNTGGLRLDLILNT